MNYGYCHMYVYMFENRILPRNHAYNECTMAIAAFMLLLKNLVTTATNH
jgi:hypothetical protein